MQYLNHPPLRAPNINASEDCPEKKGESPLPGCRPRLVQVSRIVTELDRLSRNAGSEEEREGYRDAIASLYPVLTKLSEKPPFTR